jgi:ATP-binding cassette subfamily F protein 3
VVSHDRLFLDRTVTSIVELEGGRMEGYPGNYSRYVEIRAARRLEQRRRFEEQQDFISREEAFIRRYGAGQRSREARGRRKRLNQLERLERPSAEQRVRMSFRADRLSGEVVLRAEDLACRYGDRTLFEGVRFDLYRGERMGVVGPNGCGKTSLLRMALGQTAPAAGRIALGQNLRVGYYDQLQAGLNPDRTVLDEVWELRRTMNENDVRDMLALFRFHGDDVMKRMGDCSGGERGRVALAKLMIESPNFLILDEPTHHLDIPSHEALEEALLDYDGTILVVSHDRFFLNRIVSRLLVFEPTRTRVIYGDWTSYEEARQAEEAAKAAPPTPPRAPSPPRKPAAMSKNRFAQLEARIIQLEEERARIEGELVKPEIYTDGDKVRRIMLRRREVEGELADLNAQWDAAAEAM